MTTFNTMQDAMDAGYDTPGRAGRLLEKYRGFDIKVIDTSGSPWFGYDYAVKALSSEDHIAELGYKSFGPFGETANVWVNQARNAGGKLGAVAVLFAPGVLDRAIAEARQAVDEFLS